MSHIRICLIGILALGLVQFVLAQEKTEGKKDDAPASQPAKVEPVDFRKLKELMPAELLPS